MDIAELTEQFGKGATETPPEIAATRYRLAAEPPRIIDWTTPYQIERLFTLAQRNQNGSLSCTAQATCYYCEALEQIEHFKSERYSARFWYSQTYLTGGGSFIWRPMKLALNPGAASLVSVPENQSTEQIMTDRSMNDDAILEARTDKYAQLTNNRNIDYLAGIVEDYQGFVTGFNGRNDMFLPDGTAQVFSGVSEWGHAVWVCGYEIRNGKKCLKFKNSWSAAWGSNGYGYFTEDFVKSGLMFDAYVFADIIDIDPMMKFELLQAVGSERVYAVRNNMKVWLRREPILLMFADFSDVRKVTPEFLASIPDIVPGIDPALEIMANK